MLNKHLNNDCNVQKPAKTLAKFLWQLYLACVAAALCEAGTEEGVRDVLLLAAGAELRLALRVPQHRHLGLPQLRRHQLAVDVHLRVATEVSTKFRGNFHYVWMFHTPDYV